MDILSKVWRSTENLYKRFAVSPTVSNTSRVFGEESREFVEALAKLEAISDSIALLGRGVNAEVLCTEQDRAYLNVLEEAADVIVTVLGALQSVYTPYSSLLILLDKVVEKNNAKTTETHEVRNGKIQRKS